MKIKIWFVFSFKSDIGMEEMPFKMPNEHMT